MSIFDNLKKLVKANVRKADEAIENANMEDILDQNYADEVENLRKAKLQVAEFGAELKRQTALRDSIQKKFDQAQKAAESYLEKGDEEKAITLLDSIEAEIQPELNSLVGLVQTIEKQYKEAQRNVTKKQQMINQMKASSEHVKAQHRINKMKADMATHSLDTKNESQRAQDTLKRFQERVQNQSDKIDTAEELYGDSNPNSVDNLIAGAEVETGLSAAERLAKLKGK